MGTMAGSGRGFVNTRWSLVAALDASGPAAKTPLLELCVRNWYPVYSYLRRCGHAPETAQELTRAFFDHLLDGGSSAPDGHRFGRFREFLLSELHAFLKAERAPVSANAPHPPMDVEALEARQRKDAANEGSPEQALRRGFALEIIGTALKRLRGEAKDAGRHKLFDELERYLTTAPRPGEFEAIARKRSARPTFVVMAVKRLRALVREELLQTVADPQALDEELRELRGAFSAELLGE